MRIRVDEIPDSGRSVVLCWDQTQLARHQSKQDPVRIDLCRPIEVVLEIQKQTDHVRVTGRISLEGLLACDRCLEQYPWQLEHRFETVLLPREEQPAEDEVELDGSELEYEFFDGEVIDLDLLVAEEVLLAIPMQSLCSDECRGLCARCGANLNREACRCSAASKPTAFAKLATIRMELPDK
jgi:uncharacterized protein